MSSEERNEYTPSGTTRRFFKTVYTACGLALTGSFMLIRCGKSEQQQAAEQAGTIAEKHDPADPCSDLSGISDNDIAVREKLGYVKESPLPDNQCQNCNLFLPQKEGQACGGCMLFKGPVYASGYCTYWAPKV